MIDIKDLSKEELIKELSGLNIEKFRADQILGWIYKKFIYDFDKMSNLSAEARNSLSGNFYISDLKSIKKLISEDGTMKFLFGLQDGQTVESVFIPSKNTNTICVSSQIGCKFACRFCASGKNGFVRNLRPAEIINQVMHINSPHPAPSPQRGEGRGEGVTNVVFMGTGEPFDNYDNVLKAVRILNAPYGLNIGQRKITISTCGVIPGIRKLAKEDLQVELSVSLHAANDETRSRLMGVNRGYPIKELMTACREYIKETNRQVTFEYVLIKGVNDSLKDAEALAKLLRGMLAPLDAPYMPTLKQQRLTGLAKVNLIPFNAPHPAPSPLWGDGRPACQTGRGEEEQKYSAPNSKNVKEFKEALDKKGAASVIRTTRGNDIGAACGQLRMRKKS